MNNQGRDENWKPIVLSLAIVAAVYCLLHLVAMVGVLMVVAATTAAIYYGVKLGYQVAMESEVWENRRIAKHRKLETQLKQEEEYFRSKGYNNIASFVANRSEDKARELYKEKNRFEGALNVIKKVKDVFKK